MNITKKLALPGVIAMAAFLGIVGGSWLSSSPAGAATASSTTAATSELAATDSDQTKDQSQGGHVGSNGTKEVVLTGDTATKVKAAALAAVPDGTVLRVENDAEGATYEAHMTKSDGTRIMIKLDSSFKVTTTETDDGPGPGHGDNSSSVN